MVNLHSKNKCNLLFKLNYRLIDVLSDNEFSNAVSHLILQSLNAVFTRCNVFYAPLSVHFIVGHCGEHMPRRQKPRLS